MAVSTPRLTTLLSSRRGWRPRKARAAGSSARCRPDPVIHGPGAGIAVRKEDTDLRDKFNKALKAIREDGTYKAINEKHFSFDVYGG